MGIEWQNVTKRYGSLTAVSGLSLSVRAGEIFGLLGPNGAGKSTSMSIAVGLLRPDEGRVRIGGAGDPSDAAVRRRIGLAPQALSLYDDLSAEENLAFFCEVYGMGGAARKRRLDELFELIGLSDRRRGRVSTFSGGMKRRLNLAAALVHDPEVVLLDEPTAGVDPQSRNSLFELVRHLKSAGKTVVYTTHYMEEAQKLCDRVAIIDHGNVIALGTVKELIGAHGGGSTLTIGTDDAEERRPTNDPIGDIARLRERSDVRTISLHQPDLESVFLNLTGRRLRD